jgi:hypothetical protein
MVGLEEVVKELQAPPMEEEEGAEEASAVYNPRVSTLDVFSPRLASSPNENVICELIAFPKRIIGIWLSFRI